MNTALKSKENITYNWNDYLNFPDNERWEIIDGKAVKRNSNLTIHQQIVGVILSKLSGYFKDKKCELFLSPIRCKTF